MSGYVWSAWEYRDLPYITKSIKKVESEVFAHTSILLSIFTGCHIYIFYQEGLES